MHGDGARDTRLSGIDTSWSLVRQAHDPDNPTASAIRRELFERYANAARRYLQAMMRDHESAQELLNEFAVRFLRGDLQRVDQELGSFRRYVKTVLINLVRSQRRHAAGDPIQLAFEPAVDAASRHDLFDTGWRDDLLSKTWLELQEFEHTSGRPYYTILKHKVEHPRAPSSELARILERSYPTRSCTETAARKTLQRARQAFARLLVRSVRDTLSSPKREDLLDELRWLGLITYCQPVLGPTEAE